MADALFGYMVYMIPLLCSSGHKVISSSLSPKAIQQLDEKARVGIEPPVIECLWPLQLAVGCRGFSRSPAEEYSLT